jgi:hypothetical protein
MPGPAMPMGRIEHMRPQTISLTRIILIILSILGLLVLGTFLLQNFTRQSFALDEYPIDYLATKHWLEDNRSPYDLANGDEVKGILGAGFEKDISQGITYFRYPLSTTLLFIPSLVLPLVVAQSLWMTFSIICLVTGSLLMLVLLRVKYKPVILVATALFAAFNYFSIQGIASSSLLPLLILIILLILVLLYGRHDAWAGVVGTFSLIFFQYGLLIMLFLNIWAIRGKRKQFLRSFWAMLVFEVAISLILSPNWMVGWLSSILQEITESGRYASLLSELIGINFPEGLWLNLILHLGLLLAVIASATTFKFEDDQETTWAISIIMTIASLIVFPALPGSQIFCLPALIMVVQSWLSRWERHGNHFFWIVMVILLVVPWVLSIIPRSNGVIYTQGLLFAVIGLAGLWWIRWWMMRPRY